jgi:hypothetical protein
MTFLIRHGKAVTRTAGTILELRALQHPHPAEWNVPPGPC